MKSRLKLLFSGQSKSFEIVSNRSTTIMCMSFWFLLAYTYMYFVSCPEKKGGDDIFDKLDTSKLNAHLKELMPGLTAKVFRTYNASITLDDMVRYTI